MALHREGEVAAAHAGAVVYDPDQAPPTRLHRDLDAAGAGIDGVLDEFLHGGCRPLHHLARRDTVDKDRVEAADGMKNGGHHRASIGEVHAGRNYRNAPDLIQMGTPYRPAPA